MLGPLVQCGDVSGASAEYPAPLDFLQANWTTGTVAPGCDGTAGHECLAARCSTKAQPGRSPQMPNALPWATPREGQQHQPTAMSVVPVRSNIPCLLHGTGAPNTAPRFDEAAATAGHHSALKYGMELLEPKYAYNSPSWSHYLLGNRPNIYAYPH